MCHMISKQKDLNEPMIIFGRKSGTNTSPIAIERFGTWIIEIPNSHTATQPTSAALVGSIAYLRLRSTRALGLSSASC